MSPNDSIFSQLVSQGHDRVILAALLTVAIGLAWRLREGPRATAARDIWLSSLGLLGCTAIGLAWAGLAGIFGVPGRMWSGPLDRLVAVTSIVTIGWLAGAQNLSSSDLQSPTPRWRKLLGGSFAAMLLTYVVWAPQWAMAFSGDVRMSETQAAVTNIAPLWDASQALLAVLIGGAILFGAGRTPRLTLGIIGLLLAGSTLDLINPASPLTATWTRMSALAGGLALAGTAAAHNLALSQTFAAARSTGSSRDGEVPRTRAGYGLSDVLAALHSQTSTLSLLSDRLDQLAERVGLLERGETAPEPSAAMDAPPQAASSLWPEQPPDETEPSDPIPEASADAASTEVDALESRLAQYQTVLGYLPLGVLMTDATGRISYANVSAERLLGHAGGLTGLALSEAFEQADQLHAGLRQAIEQTGSLGSPVSIEIQRPPVHVELFGLRPPPEGELAGLLAVISPKGEAEGGLAETLVPGLAAALRAPVNSILGYSQLLRKGSTLAEGQVQRYLERIDANLSRMQIMLENVGTVLRAEGTKARQSSARIDLEASIDQAIERARYQLDEKGLAVERALDPKLGRFTGQPDVLAQILDNLLLHATRRSPQGGDLRIEAGPLDDGDGSMLALVIQDRGPMPGKGSDSGQTEVRVEDEGFGLELRMVALLTRLHGGRAWVERHPLGSMARVALPIGDER